jgi:eukaryotic-like serine/threonine-protein kinase
MMADSAPSQLGRFQIRKELGRGAMGVVYEAHDPALDRTVALKTIMLTGDASERAAYEARFMQEARAAGRLSHPAVITIYDVGREGELAWIAMERLHGVDLREQLAKQRPPAKAALTIAMQVAEGLAYAHQTGVVHRDIKPANIMLMKGGRAKIMDFGIARLHASDIKTQTGVVLGTPKYMSPEQLAGRPLDHRSDIFSLGAVLYEMLTSQPPFTGADVSQLMHNIANTPHVAPTRLVQGLPAVLDLILARALEKEPEQRYQHAQELADDLQSALTELPARPVPAAAFMPGDTGDGTERLPSRGASTGERTIIARGPSTAFHPVSQRFDSAKALERLAAPSIRDRQRLGSTPRRPGPIERVLRDPDLRLLAAALLSALLAALAISFR